MTDNRDPYYAFYMIDLIFAGIGTAASAVRTAKSLATSRKGAERSFLLSVQQNIQLLEEFRKNELSAEKLIPELETRAFAELYGTSYRFTRLQRNKVSAKSTSNIRSLKRYEGWDTEKLVVNIFTKITHLQKIIRIGYPEGKYDMPRRLLNLLGLFILLTRHIQK